MRAKLEWKTIKNVLKGNLKRMRKNPFLQKNFVTK